MVAFEIEMERCGTELVVEMETVMTDMTLDAGDEKTKALQPSHISVFDYYRVLRDNRSYALLLLSYCVDNIGNWLTFVACITLADQLGGALYVSIFLTLRLFPSMLLSWVVGPLADRLDKRWTLIGCSIGSGLAVASLMLPLPDALRSATLFISVFVQFSFMALYNPTRNSLVPLLVPKADLIVATTIDGLGWATIGALGASLGGIIASVFGIYTCFAFDVVSYFSCAALIYAIPPLASTRVSDGGSAEEAVVATPSATMSDAIRYLRTMPRLAGYCLVKASAALLWGATDVTVVKLSEINHMHSIGDTRITLGLIFAAVGLGCQLGPIIWNNCTAQEEKALMKAVIFSQLQTIVSYAIMSVSTNVYMILLSTVIRAMGSSTLWIYSNLMIQIAAPNDMQGRVFAIEGAIYNICEIASANASAFFYDYLRCTPREVCVVLTIVGSVTTALWAVFYLMTQARDRNSDSRTWKYDKLGQNVEIDDVNNTELPSHV